MSCRIVESSIDGIPELVELSNRRLVELWNGGVVESSNGGMVELVARVAESLNRRFVQWWNDGFGSFQSSSSRMGEWLSWSNCRFVER